MTKPEAYPINDLKDFKGWRLANPVAAKLLDTIIFRWRVCTIKVRGKPGPWAVYPRLEWCDHSGLSFHQYKRAVSVLVTDGLVLSERHRFAGSKVLAHLQPTSRALDYAGRPDDIKRLGAAYSPPDTPSAAPLHAPSGAPADHTYVPTSTISTTDTIVCASCSEDACTPSSGDSFSGKMEKNASGMPQPLKKTITTVWIEAVKQFYPNTPMPLTSIQGKQLKDFSNACPPEYAGNILRHTIENWAMFIGMAKTQQAAYNAPNKPTTGFLLKFISTAIRLWQEDYNLIWKNEEIICESAVVAQSSTQELAPVKVEQKKSTGVMANVHQKYEEKKMTSEELQAILADDDS